MTTQTVAGTVNHGTFTVERSYPVSTDKVFAAFADREKKARWYGDRDTPIEQFDMHFRVGGQDRFAFRMGPTTPIPGALLTYDTTYQDIVPERRLVFSYTLSVGDQRVSASLATVEFVPTEQGTDLIFTEQGAYFDGADGPAIRKSGWGALLDTLGKHLGR